VRRVAGMIASCLERGFWVLCQGLGGCDVEEAVDVDDENGRSLGSRGNAPFEISRAGNEPLFGSWGISWHSPTQFYCPKSNLNNEGGWIRISMLGHLRVVIRICTSIVPQLIGQTFMACILSHLTLGH
jgi:hypothetical protein